jgi:hypothetical protein
LERADRHFACRFDSTWRSRCDERWFEFTGWPLASALQRAGERRETSCSDLVVAAMERAAAVAHRPPAEERAGMPAPSPKGARRWAVAPDKRPPEEARERATCRVGARATQAASVVAPLARAALPGPLAARLPVPVVAPAGAALVVARARQARAEQVEVLVRSLLAG